VKGHVRRLEAQHRSPRIGIAEIGPQRSLRGSDDYAELIAAIRDRYPRTVFFQAWAWDWSLSRNRNAPALLADPWMIGRDELPRRGTE
jgi:mannan endo-1,4-beta-mannosidase